MKRSGAVSPPQQIASLVEKVYAAFRVRNGDSLAETIHRRRGRATVDRALPTRRQIGGEQGDLTLATDGDETTPVVGCGGCYHVTRRLRLGLSLAGLIEKGQAGM